jgi:SAM-dependent methyltransferase
MTQPPVDLSIERRWGPEGTFSERFPILFRQGERNLKAEKVIRVLSDFGGDLSKLTCLDLGASTCIMSRYFAGHFESVIALDNDTTGLKYGREIASPNLFPLCGDGARLPLPDESVDCIICNQVYEHIENQTGLVVEMHRVLKPDGFIYMGAGNRYVLIEAHYKLPFLSWLPRKPSNWYMHAAGRKMDYDVYLLSYLALKRLLRQFAIHDYTFKVLENPEKFAATDVVPGWMKWIKPSLLKPFKTALPAWIWVLTKKPA